MERESHLCESAESEPAAPARNEALDRFCAPREAAWGQMMAVLSEVRLEFQAGWRKVAASALQREAVTAKEQASPAGFEYFLR